VLYVGTVLTVFLRSTVRSTTRHEPVAPEPVTQGA
jgi:hypothetical protein